MVRAPSWPRCHHRSLGRQRVPVAVVRPVAAVVAGAGRGGGVFAWCGRILSVALVLPPSLSLSLGGGQDNGSFTACKRRRRIHPGQHIGSNGENINTNDEIFTDLMR